MKWYELLFYMEEIKFEEKNNNYYKYISVPKEGDLSKNSPARIEDMLLLLVQKKLSNLERDVIINLGCGIWMFYKDRYYILSGGRPQLGVESYQKKLNITKPETFRLMRTDELYKFSDGTLTSIRTLLHDIASNLRMDYLPKRRWSSLDKKGLTS
ncbi:hypothetical protein Tco_1105200 [Tanacetum coccineum]